MNDQPRKRTTEDFHNDSSRNSTSQASSQQSARNSRLSAKHNRKRSSSSLSYRTAQNASYKQVNDKKEKKKRGCLGNILLPVVFLFLIIFILLFLYLRSSFNKVEKYELDLSSIAINDNDTNIDQYENIALFGVDNQDNEITDTGSRTDSIIIASINKSTKEVKLMSIYRDTYVSIDGEYDKINAAYSYGGPEQALNTINRNLDLNITDFATVNFKALADAVDIVGGIELTIKSETELENLNAYVKNMNNINGGDSPTFDDVGTYTFDGNQAVAYARIRYMEGGDHERANHQRLVLSGIVKKLKQQPWKINQLANTVIPQCKTSLSTSDMTRLSLSLLRYSIADSQAYPFESVDEKYGGIYYGFPLTAYSNTIEAHEYLFGTLDYEPTEELIKISAKIENVTDMLGY